jgi:phosphatidylserine synthase
MNKTKDRQVTGMSIVAAALFFVSMMALDSDSWVPLIVCVVSLIWLTAEAWRNGWMYDPEDEEE